MSIKKEELDLMKAYERALFIGCGDPYEPRVKTDYLNIYSKIVSSAKDGAYLH